MTNDILNGQIIINGQIVVEHDFPEEFYWAELAMPCRSENNDFEVGDHALCKDPGYAEYIGKDPKRGVLLRYRTNESATGSLAPNGAVFFVSLKEYEKFPPRGAAKLRKAEKDNLSRDAEYLLKQSRILKWY